MYVFKKIYAYPLFIFRKMYTNARVQHDSPVIWPSSGTLQRLRFFAMMVTDTLTDMHFRKCMSVSVSVTIKERNEALQVQGIGQITGESC